MAYHVVLTVALIITTLQNHVQALSETPHERHLALAIVLTRHGDRAPLHSYPGDILDLSKWPSGRGGLTPFGIRAMFNLGRRLREHYITELEFLKPHYDRHDVYVRSSDYDVTLMSAQALMYGMFPTGSAPITEVGNAYNVFPRDADLLGLPNQAQPVAIRSAVRGMDGVLVPGGWCPRHNQLQHIRRRSRPWFRRQSYHDELLAQLTHETQSVHHILLQDVVSVADTWTCHKAHGVPLPKYGDVLLPRARLAAEWVRNYTNSGHEARRLRAGLLLHEISKRLRLAHAVSVGHVHHDFLHLHSKFVLLSAHDSTIASALAALDAFDGRNPPYNSTLIWELHTHKWNKHDATVRIMYNGKPVHIHGCPHHEPCQLHDYLHHTAKVTMRSHAQRYRECLTGILRVGAEILHFFVPEPLDEDDHGRAEEPHGGMVFAVFFLFVVAGIVGAKAYDRTHGLFDGNDLAQRVGLARADQWTPLPGHEPQEDRPGGTADHWLRPNESKGILPGG